MSDVQSSSTAPTAVADTTVNQQPGGHAQPTYRKYSEKYAGKYGEQTGSEEWASDIFDCFNSPDTLCLKGTFCPCFVYGKTQARTRDPTLASYERFNPDCMIFAGASCVCGLSWILTFLKRKETREQYRIRGDTVTDCLLGYCCHCCALIQIEKETCARTGTPYTPVAGTGYVAPQGMTAAPGAGAGAAVGP